MAQDKRRPVIYKGAKHTIRFFITDVDTQERVDLTGKTIKVLILADDGTTFEASTTNGKVAIIEKGIFDMTLETTDTVLLRADESADFEVEIADISDTDISQKRDGLIIRDRLFQ